VAAHQLVRAVAQIDDRADRLAVINAFVSEIGRLLDPDGREPPDARS
jgi:hypothetical protein